MFVYLPVIISVLPSGNDFGFGLVDAEDVGELEYFRVEIEPRRSRVRDGPDAVFAREFQNPEECLVKNCWKTKFI